MPEYRCIVCKSPMDSDDYHAQAGFCSDECEDKWNTTSGLDEIEEEMEKEPTAKDLKDPIDILRELECDDDEDILLNCDC